MNKARRKELMKLKERIENVRAEINDVNTELICNTQEVQEYLDNMLENLQGSEQAEKTQETLDRLDEIIETLETVTSELEDAETGIKEACG